ncbi:MAG: DUF2142 domain-containing protein [Eubacterium sp.]|nr:DUF2142 domain-containing protein [Eubacterium sp.]
MSELKKTITSAIALSVFLIIAFILVYNVQIIGILDDNIVLTLMNKHKENFKTELNGIDSVYTQDFILDLEGVKELKIRCKRKKDDEEAFISFTLTDADTGEVLAEKDGYSSEILKKKNSYIRLPIEESKSDFRGRNLRLTVELEDAVETRVRIVSNNKNGIVSSVNGDSNNKTNIIYGVEYGSKLWLRALYIAVVIMLSFLFILCFVLFIIRKCDFVKAYIPLAFAIGIIMSLIFLPHGIPDEPGHIDTAYMYSNVILGRGKTPNGLLEKRHCDVVQDDMLVNGLESNSYYQLKQHLFTRPKDTDIISVSFDYTGGIVPDIVYIPMALGIAIGRLLGLSTFMIYFLGRLLNLCVFIFITYLAIKIIPCGKNLMAFILLLPINMQQAMSASYDCVLNAVIILFIAYVFMVYKREKIKKRDIIILALSALVIAMSKGGVYIPLCLLLIGLPFGFKKHMNRRILVIVLAIIIVLIGVLIYAEYPVLKSLLIDGTVRGESNLYTFADVTADPLNVIYLYWNTINKKGASLIMELLGGKLSWLGVRASWMFLIPFIIGLLLLANVEGEKIDFDKKKIRCIVITSVIVFLLLFASMLVGFTQIESEYIQGLQGRYFLPIFPLCMMLLKTDMINVKKEKISSIAMFMMMSEIMILLESIPQVI